MSNDDVKYEYRLLARTRRWRGPNAREVREGHAAEGWTGWSEWSEFSGYNRSSPVYPTIRGARSVVLRYGGERDYRPNHEIIDEREFRIQRRPIANTWEDL